MSAEEDIFFELKFFLKYETNWCVSTEKLRLDEIIIPGNNIKIRLFGYELISENGSIRNLWKTCENLYQIRNACFQCDWRNISVHDWLQDNNTW